jgi:hypothetical protein
MHEYSNVEVIPLDGQQSKDRKVTANVLSIKKVSEKSYSILAKGGETFCQCLFLLLNDNDV